MMMFELGLEIKWRALVAIAASPINLNWMYICT